MTKQTETRKHLSIINATKTKKGYEVKSITWVEKLNRYVGYVKDPLWENLKSAKLNNGFVSMSWNIHGLPINSLRSGLILKF